MANLLDDDDESTTAIMTMKQVIKMQKFYLLVWFKKHSGWVVFSNHAFFFLSVKVAAHHFDKTWENDDYRNISRWIAQPLFVQFRIREIKRIESKSGKNFHLQLQDYGKNTQNIIHFIGKNQYNIKTKIFQNYILQQFEIKLILKLKWQLSIAKIKGEQS